MADHSKRLLLIADAQRKGFTVKEEDGGWWVVTPARKRQPSADHGEFRSPERAWMAAALMALELED